MAQTVRIAHLNSASADFRDRLNQLLRFDAAQDEEIGRTVKEIIAAVRAKGDEALLRYTAKFDGVTAKRIAELEISKRELQEAFDSLGSEQKKALSDAAARISEFHELQKQSSWTHTDSIGNRLGQRVSAIDRAGLYVPGGKAAYPSSVLMNAIPAKVAGVGEIIMVVPTPQGLRNPLVLAAARLAGVDRAFTIGGAQAIAALAYGTSTVPSVDKIVGPGNAYVAEAKRQVFGRVGIDMIAGPSEILVISDGKTEADWIAMDLFSQAEHDELAQAILLTPDASHISAVQQSIDRLIESMPRQKVIRASMENRGALICVRDLNEACEIATSIAAEHLEISADQPEIWADKIRHAGAIFMGRYASESLGDYCAGPNHVLPTMRTARFSSPLGVYDFQKRTSMIEISEKGAQALGPIASTLAWGEELPAHARAAELRLNKKS